MSLKTNFLYSSLLTVSGYLVPLLIYPYVSRTLGLSNIGIVNFVDNIISYFIVVSMMGIMTVGVREIAVVRGNRGQLSNVFISLLTLTIMTTLIAIVVLWIAMYTVPKLIPYQDMLYIGIVKLVSNLFLMEWFYMGMEEFRYITIRSIIIKLLYVVSVFCLVREESDYQMFYILTVEMVVVNALINVLYSRHFISYHSFSISIRPFVKTYFIMGFYVMLINFYSSLNTVWLGFVTNTDEVGFFTTATKLHTIIMGILASFTNILFPRVSHLLSEGKTTEFWEKIHTSLNAVFVFAFPTMTFMMVAGPEIMHLFLGDGFEGAYLPMRIITPLVLIIGVEQIIVIQILLAMHKDSIVMRNCFYGAMISIIVNILLTAKLGAIGSALVWVAAESSILCFSLLAVNKAFQYTLPYKRIGAYCLSYAPLFVLSCIWFHFSHNLISLFALTLLTGAYTLVTELYILKNPLVLQIISSFVQRIKKNPS